MSLLLDALKKAADDKQKASQAEASDSAPPASNPIVQDQESQLETDDLSNGELRPAVDETELQLADESKTTNESVADATEELTLEEPDTDSDDKPLEAITEEGLSLNEEGLEDGVSVNAHAAKADTETKQKDELSLEDNGDAGSGGFTVSDDALSMLIYKTNSEIKQSKRYMIATALVASLFILVSGGIYYYLDMQAEISALERKHQIAMQSMRAKTNKEKTPEKSEIIRNLVGDSDLDEKVQYAKQHMNTDGQVSTVQPAVNNSAARNNRNLKQDAILSIQKSKKSDPVGEKLDAAWLAYESGQYDIAKGYYKDVLASERNNRDALLGLGAVAVIEKDHAVARDIYMSLLEQDPRDSIATAALAGMHDETTLKADEQYLLSMLDKSPSAQHLVFALGNNYAQQKKWKSAQQYYFDAWQSDSDNADYTFNLAVSMDQLNKSKQALGFYKDSLLKAKNKQVGFSREVVQKRINELSEL